jgi:uncharacterized protein YukE
MTMLQRWLPLAAFCLAAFCLAAAGALDAARAQDGGRPPDDRPTASEPRPRFNGQPPRGEGRPNDGPARDGPPRDGQIRGFGGGVPGFENGPRPFGPPRPDGPPLSGGPRGPAPFNLDELRERDPEMFALMQSDIDLDRRTHELASAVQRAEGAEQAALRKELERAASEHFDVRQERRSMQLKRMEEELARLRESIEKRNEIRSAIIQQHIAELLGENENLDF